MGHGDRPEHVAPPDVYYNEEEARKYVTNSRMISIQAALTERALELLALPEDGTPKMLLDVGCGSGLSGETITDHGHFWLGFDISAAMLDVALEREVEGDLGLLDLGHGLPLRPGTFDGAVSISAIQWLCNADRAGHEPRKRIKRFFESLYICLARGARAVLQMYPENASQAEMLVAAAMRVGFSGGLVVDYPHSTRAKKFFLVLMVGSSFVCPQARGLEGAEPEDEEVEVMGRHKDNKRQRVGKKGGKVKGRQWLLHKKDRMRHKGYDVPGDSRYTGRKRKHLV